jgi:transposase InsO family protein
VVDDYSRYAWVFFLEEKGETFVFVQDLFLTLRNERHKDAIRAIRSDNGSDSETLVSKPFAMTWVLNTSFRVCICLPRMVW